jgi:hypothetical protein
MRPEVDASKVGQEFDPSGPTHFPTEFPFEKRPAVECDILRHRVGGKTRSASIVESRSPREIAARSTENSVETFDSDPIRRSDVCRSGMR